jgi:hypothetical protein
MSMFAETAIVGYNLSFPEQGKQTIVFCFHLQQINGSLPFLFSVGSKQMELPFYIALFSVYIYIYIGTVTEKRKPW